MEQPNLSIPILFQKLDEYETTDTRFAKVKIWLMHLEENFNSSYFSKESVEKAIPSLANTPILGFLETNDNGEDDFSDHRRVLTKNSKGEWKYKYLGQAFGTIPESNNAQFEWRLCDDGKMREYLTVEGLMWTKWEDPIDILTKDSVKSHSMELHDKSVDGYFDEDSGLFHVTDFQVFGACILGLDTKPAMVNSTIELQSYSVENFQKEIQSKMEEYKFFQLNKSKGGNLMDLKLKLLTKFSKTEEDIKTMGISLEEISLEELENRLSEDVSEDENLDDKSKEENLDGDSNSGENTGENFEIEDDKSNEEEQENVETKEDEKETKEENKEEEEEVNYQELYENLKVENEKLQADFTTLEESVTELKDFKRVRLAEDRKANEETLFEKYSVLDGVEEFETLKEKSSDFSEVEDLEKEIALVFARNYSKLSFSKGESEDKNKFNFDEPRKKSSKYGDLFDKYGE